MKLTTSTRETPSAVPLKRSRSAAVFAWLAAAFCIAVSLGSGCAGGAETGSTASLGGGLLATTSASGGAGGGVVTATTTTTTTTTTVATTSVIASTTSTGMGGGMGGATATGAGGTVVCTPVTGSTDYPAETEQNDTQTSANVLPAGAKGFTGQLCPIGDQDVYEITVPASTALSLSITTNGTGCPGPGHIEMILLDTNFVVIASEIQNKGSGGCPILAAPAFPALASLPAGNYYVNVKNLSAQPIGAYQLDVQLIEPHCGDGAVAISNNEQCDDGNTTDGDGCSATCQIESGHYRFEFESNDTFAHATNLDGYDGAVGSLEPAGDKDTYKFTVTTAGSSVIADLGDGFGHCPARGNWKPDLLFFDSTGTMLDHESSGDPDGCPEIAPSVTTAATNLPVGQYFLRVISQSSTATTPFYVLTVHVKAPGCGDGIVEPGEDCDDGNTTSGDGCSSTCKWEKNYIPETEPNDSLSTQANPLGSADGFIASLSDAHDSDAFSFVIPHNHYNVEIVLDNGLGQCPNFDARVRLFDPSGTVIAAEDGSGPGPCVTIDPTTTNAATQMPLTDLAAGTYKVYVTEIGSGSVPQYILQIRSFPAACGDGYVESGEQCDDGNTTSGDGCSATCQVEAPYEMEPNGTKGTATPVWAGFNDWIGSISPADDEDFYVFVLTQTSAVTLTTHDVGDPTMCSFDTVLDLRKSSGAVVAHDDNGGIGGCSSIDPNAYPAVAMLPAGTYYAVVSSGGRHPAVIPKYQLDLSIQ